MHVVCLSDYPRELVDSWLVGAPQPATATLAPRDATIGDLAGDLARADVVVGDASRRFRLDAATLRGLDRCRLVVQPSVGLDGVIDVDAAAAQGIEVVSAPGYNAEAVADWTVMAMLVVLRDAVAADAGLRTYGWSARPLGRELGALTVGIVGFGSIGRAVRRRLAGFGSAVLYHDVAPRPADEDGARHVDLDTLFAESDVVTLHAPLVGATHHLVDAARLARMRPGAVLVNASRGGLVDETALAAALRDGRLAGAALDVFETEPVPRDHELLRLATFVTPHVAAGTEQARRRVRALVGDVVRSALAAPPGRRSPLPSAGHGARTRGART
ncbi:MULTISPECIES: 2-hydroxyacid dehydrogenase [unclassified Actinotalea]|uniref:2-hydroxyacid dehydrogenase n=1 Tax=unclassified Actinotalea TaxID=2638618 RepID=UPI0015F66137|nr:MULTISPECIES: NAD(P)-dependent oxidoreductase [unclassified Actinotalea]